MFGYRKIDSSRSSSRPWWACLVCCGGGTEETADVRNPTVRTPETVEVATSTVSGETMSPVVSIRSYRGDRRYAEVRPSWEGQTERQLQVLSELLQNTRTIMGELERLSSTDGYLVMRPVPAPWVPDLPPRPQNVYTDWLVERLLYAEFWL